MMRPAHRLFVREGHLARRAEPVPDGKRSSLGLQAPEIVPLKFRTCPANVGVGRRAVKRGSSPSFCALSTSMGANDLGVGFD